MLVASVAGGYLDVLRRMTNRSSGSRVRRAPRDLLGFTSGSQRLFTGARWIRTPSAVSETS